MNFYPICAAHGLSQRGDIFVSLCHAKFVLNKFRRAPPRCRFWRNHALNFAAIKLFRASKSLSMATLWNRNSANFKGDFRSFNLPPRFRARSILHAKIRKDKRRRFLSTKKNLRLPLAQLLDKATKGDEPWIRRRPRVTKYKLVDISSQRVAR